MSSEDTNDNGDSASADPGDGGEEDNSVDALLDALLSESDDGPSDTPSITDDEASAAVSASDSSYLEEGIVSSLLDDLMSAVPGSTDPDFTEGATAMPFGDSSNDTSPVGTEEVAAATAAPLDAEDPTFAIAALAGNEDPTAAVEAFIDPDPTGLLNVETDVDTASVDVDTSLVDTASEDPTAIIDTSSIDTASEDPTAIIETPIDGQLETVTSGPDADAETATDTDSVADTEISLSESATDATVIDTSDREAPRRVPQDSRSSGRRPLAILALCAVGVFLLVGLAWAVDSISSQGKVLRGTTYAGESIQGLSESELEDRLAERTDELADEDLDVAIGDVTVTSDPVTMGVSLDNESIVSEAMNAGRDGFILFRPFSWIGRFFSTQDIEERYRYDNDLTTESTETILLAPLDQVEEPELTYEGAALGVKPGATGTTVDASELVQLLPSVMDGGTPYQVDLRPVDQIPALSDDQVQAIADEINTTTAESLALRVLDDVAVVETDQLRAWSKLINDGDGEAAWELDNELAQNELQPLFPSLGSEDQQARFVVVDDEPTIVPASETVVCCGEDSAERIREGLNDAPLELSEEELEELDNDDPTAGLRIVGLDPITVGADEGVAELESLGIIEEVSTFTSNHACCQNRVTNIQRFADLMQGAIIRPGETISLNGHVGQRTREKGFVADGAINLGVLEPQVGGGISQYATTFFNASFFAGLEFVEYQSHSLYISRYPRGREATISWRRPDLQVKNTTPYGILIWNTYTPTSITVTFYSTEHLEVEALPLRRASERQCRVDITPRLITFPDGTEVEDSVYAVYRPGEGLDCNGDSTRPDLEPESTPTTADTDDGGEGEAAGATTTVPDPDAGIDDAVTTTTIAEDPNEDT